MGDDRQWIDRIGDGSHVAEGIDIIRSGNKYPNRGFFIGDHSYIHSGSRFILGNLDDHPAANLVIGNFVHINWGCYVSGEGGLEIGDRVLIGPNVSILSAGHEYIDRTQPILNQGLTYGKIVIEEDVWIGGGSVVLQNVKLGKGCVVGGGSTVVNDVPSYSVVAGNPTRVIKWRGDGNNRWSRFLRLLNRMK